MALIVVYARVSKPDQNIDHQKDNLWEYTTEDLDFDPQENTIEVLDDKRTGTNIDRSGYREMMRLVREGEADVVVCREVTRLGRSMREISENTHAMVEDYNVGLYVMNDDLEVDQGAELTMRDKMLLNVLAWAAELEAQKISENTIAGIQAAKAAGKWVGRPPYGFTTDDDGHLQPDTDFSRALNAISAVEDLGWSHRKAAQHSGVPRRTVPALLDRKDLYLAEMEEPD